MSEQTTIVEVLNAARDHLEYCGYGDAWERQVAFDSKLPESLDKAIERAKTQTAQIREALEWLDKNAPGRARDVLIEALGK